MPVNSIKKVFNTNAVDYISAVSRDSVQLNEKSGKILELVEKSNKTNGIFYIEDINSEKEKIENATGLLKNIIGAIALISLIVGGIGVMNIMLVSVNERTREIGIKKSIGAKNSDILEEFLIEALIITLFAAILGMAAGIGVSVVCSKVLDITFILSWHSLMKIFAISFFTGIIFGGYPALIAANQNPVTALRE
jgi:putative ABC transport system permease protein